MQDTKIQKTKKFLLQILSAIVASVAIASPALARTWPVGEYSKDRAANFNHVFGVYKPLSNYQDADFAEGAAMASPLYNPLYASYDVIIVANKTNVYSADKKVVERAQRVRVYVREEALLANISADRLQNVNYDRASGLLFYFKTSTGKAGHTTPSGHFRVLGFSSAHESAKYNNSPMPFAVWFDKRGYYSHGVAPQYFGLLGQPASKGCLRLETQRSRDLFHLIGQIGQGSIDVLDIAGRPVRDASGNVKQIRAYKAIYIIR